MNFAKINHIVMLLLILLAPIINSPSIGYTQELKVAFAKWPPWKIIENGEYSGIDAEILKTIAQKNGFFIQFYECPWKRCIELFKKGDVDLITSFGKTQERELYTYYLGEPYKKEYLRFWIHNDSSLKIDSYQDLYDKKIGIIKGSVYFPKFDNDAQLIKESVNFENQLFKMLQANRIDLVIGYETTIEYLLAKEGFEGEFKKTTYKIQGFASYIGMSKKSEASKWRSQITQTVQGMINSGEIESIITGY